RPSNGASDIRNWRTRHEWAALGAERVVAPSKDAAARMQRYTGVQVSVQYHEPELDASDIRARKGRGAKPYHVLLLGALPPHKGLATLIDLANTVRTGCRPLEFHLIGYPDGVGTERLPFSFTGHYAESDLDEMIEAHAPDAFLFL